MSLCQLGHLEKVFLPALIVDGVQGTLVYANTQNMKSRIFILKFIPSWLGDLRTYFLIWIRKRYVCFFRRRRVFIGECDGQAVYYDQQTGEALAAPKKVSCSLKRLTNAHIPENGYFLMAGGPGFWIFFSYVHWCL